MKKLLSTLVFFGVIGVLAYFYLDYKAEKKDERAEFEQRKKELEEMREQEKQQSRVLLQEDRQRQQKIIENRKIREDIISGRRGAPALAIPTPLPTKNTQSTFRHKSTVETACREARCALIKYQESGDSSCIVVQGPDHNTVSDVLDSLIRAGMKDFTEHKDQYKVQMVQGRRVYTAAYTIKW